MHTKATVHTDYDPDKLVQLGMKWDGKEQAIVKCAKHAPEVVSMIISELLSIDDRKELRDLIKNLKIIVKNVEHQHPADRE